ncbi:thioester domain-containing protein [Tautonia plasticadhaerens]|uniref:PEP-CTERM protein-sorting domain-containing protein n=1 Tax=Tautonia plasticadhaerens TaxID=2527974 RepID=A0A518HDE2_9BACT|nr:thioester domain-containing protein [Tautonia plasticadhaerens]QDV38874.1 hypothetical protein ElP_68330 [Tautonia plasticadhaerens]
MAWLLGPACALTLIALAASAPTARAGLMVQANTTFNGGNNGINVDFRFGTGSWQGTSPGNFTTIVHGPSPFGTWNVSFTTYCVDLSEYVQPSSPNTAMVSLTGESGLLDTNSRPRDIGAAGWVLENYGFASPSELKAAGGLASNVNLTTKEASAAIQLAIWEATYDGSGAGGTLGVGTNYLGTGSLTFRGSAYDNANVSAVANGILSLRDVRTSAVGLFNYPPIAGGPQTPADQDQIFLPPAGTRSAVPEPSTLAMAAVGGLIGLASLCRQRLRRKTPRP